MAQPKQSAGTNEHSSVEPVTAPDYESVPKEHTVGDGGRTAAHCMLWASTQSQALHGVPVRALVMMQLRDDGYFGFPGGLLDEGETVLQALNREIGEELGTAVDVSDGDHVCTHATKFGDTRWLLHFYAKQLTEEAYLQVERGALAAEHFGTESFGIVRVPTFVTRHRGGLPVFLQHKFIANGRQQLLNGLRHAGILSQGEIDAAMGMIEQ